MPPVSHIPSMETVFPRAGTARAANVAAGAGSDVVLALDLGSTWLKGGLVRPDGIVLHVERVASPLRASRPLDAEAVWQEVLTLLLRLHALSGQAAQAIAVTGATRTHVFVDAAGRPLAPICCWDDPCGAQWAVAVAKAYGLPDGTPGMGAFHPLARLREHVHTHRAVPQAMAELKDWLNFRLTGRLVTDAVVLGRIAPEDEALPLSRVLSRLGLPGHVIPPPAAPDTLLGPVDGTCDQRLAALHDLPVAVGSFDTWASCLGMGALRDGSIYDVSGTTQVLGLFSREPRRVPGMVSMSWAPGLWQLGGPCQTGLGTLAWYARTFLDSEDPADTLSAAASSTAHDTPLCLPYLSGERMPLWDSTLSASFHGVKSYHSRADMAQGLVEGLVLAHRLALDAMQARRPHAVLRMGGGGSQLQYWVQTRADAFAMPIVTGVSGESALAGAAMAAATALGAHAGLDAAQSAMEQHETRVLPCAERSAYFNERAKNFSIMLNILQDAGSAARLDAQAQPQAPGGAGCQRGAGRT